ncbi:MAG TPA: hypothetical protein VJC14_02860 [Candidatus Paceibacterota bacterium]
MIPDKIIFFALSLNLLGHILYIRSVIRGQAKPNLASWIPWMLAPLVGVFFQLKAGAGLSVLPVFMAGFGPMIIIIAALLSKNSLWKLKTIDLFCFGFSIFALVLYVLTHNLALSIIFAILSDALAFIPTYIKAWKFPESESVHAYSWAILSNIIGLLIIREWIFTIYSFGIYLVVANGIFVLILYRRKLFSKFLRNY